MRTIKIDYTPSPKQRVFHATDADEVLYGGAAGGGKSHGLVFDALDRCLRTPGANAYLFRRTFPELRDSLIQTALMYIPRELGRYNSSTHTLKLVNGSEMRFRHCNNDADKMIYQGAEIHYLYIDELTHFSREVYDFLKTRLRAPVGLGIKPNVRCTSNPGGPGHSWVKSYFVDAGEYGVKHEREIKSEITGEAQIRTVQYIPATVRDNPYIGADYIYELEQKPKALRDALLNGNWDAFEGQVFTEWRNDPNGYTLHINSHVIKPFEVPAWWTRYRSFDFGYSRPFAVLWWAVDPDGVVYLYREWYGCAGVPNEGIRIHPREIAKGILDVERAHGEDSNAIMGLADPSMWDNSRGEAVADQMAAEGVYFNKGANDRLAGKMQVHYRLAFDENGRAMMYVFDTCKHFIRTLPALAYDVKKPEDVDTDGEDHAYDAARYFLMDRPIKARERKTPPRRRSWWE